MSFIIKEATVEDIPGIRALAELFFRKEYASTYDPAYIEGYLKRIYSESGLARSITNSTTHFLLAMDENVVVGLSNYGAPLLEDCKERNEIFRFFIHPDYDSSEIATLLIDEMMKRFQQGSEVTECIIYLQKENATRHDFFSNHKFIHRPNLDHEDNICMLRHINS